MAVAVLLQVVLAAPLALRMEAGPAPGTGRAARLAAAAFADSAFADSAFAGAGSSDARFAAHFICSGGVPPAGAPGPAVPPHRHEHCLLCQGGFGPVALAAPGVVPAAAGVWRAAYPAGPAAPAPHRVPSAYAPRAPPLDA